MTAAQGLTSEAQTALRCQQICARYQQIEQQAMAGLPVLNPALAVACCGFEPQHTLQQRPLGILITPWCMNLMLLPADGECWDNWAVGAKQMIDLPSGYYEVIHGDDAILGRYAACSLFSPMFEFEDQAAVLATAESILTALFEAEHQAPSERARAMVESDYDASESNIELSESDESAADIQPEPATPAGLSRRGFLTGGRWR